MNLNNVHNLDYNIHFMPSDLLMFCNQNFVSILCFLCASYISQPLYPNNIWEENIIKLIWTLKCGVY
jgi:hypothetical protein